MPRSQITTWSTEAGGTRTLTERRSGGEIGPIAARFPPRPSQTHIPPGIGCSFAVHDRAVGKSTNSPRLHLVNVFIGVRSVAQYFQTLTLRGVSRR